MTAISNIYGEREKGRKKRGEKTKKSEIERKKASLSHSLSFLPRRYGENRQVLVRIAN